MKFAHIAVGLLLAGLLLAAAPSAYAAGANTKGLKAACEANADLQSTLGNQGGEAMSNVCACYVEQLAPQVSPTDIDMLTKSLNGTATDEEMMNYGTFEDLDAVASQAFSDCMVIEGYADGVDPGATGGDETGGDEVDTGSNMEQTDAGPFQATCEQSDWSDYPEIASDEDLSNTCSCIAGGLFEKGALNHDFESLQAYYNGDKSPDEVEQSNPGLMAMHDGIMNQCLAQL